MSYSENKTAQEIIAEIEEDLKRERERRRQNEETDERCRAILRPYALKGLTFGQVQAKEHCPGSLAGLYQGLLQETASERAKAAQQQDKPGAGTEAETDPFLVGFMSGYGLLP